MPKKSIIMWLDNDDNNYDSDDNTCSDGPHWRNWSDKSHINKSILQVINLVMNFTMIDNIDLF